MEFRTLLALVFVSILITIGCNGDASDDDVADDDTGDDDTAMPDDDVADDDTGDDDTTPPEEPYIIGTVLDITCTTPIEGLRVTFCQEACIFKTTDAAGQFVFGGLEPGVDGYMNVVGHVNTDEKYYTGLIHEVHVPASGFVELDDICLPEIPSLVSLSSGTQDVAVGDGLELTVDPDAVDWVMKTPQIGAVEVPDTAWQYVDIEGVDVTAVWAFYVWGSTSTEPLPTRLPMRASFVCADGIDNDCDGSADESCGVDADGDGFTESDGDCDDSDDAVHPGAVEVCGNGQDNDCDGSLEDGADDLDADGYSQCAGDCDDADPDIHPLAVEVCGDGVDNNCDGHLDEVCGDVDGDGYTTADGDCDDGDSSIHPFAADACSSPVQLYWMSIEDHSWQPVGPADLDCAQQTISSGAGQGITEVTWLAYGIPQ